MMKSTEKPECVYDSILDRGTSHNTNGKRGRIIYSNFIIFGTDLHIEGGMCRLKNEFNIIYANDR